MVGKNTKLSGIRLYGRLLTYVLPYIPLFIVSIIGFAIYSGSQVAATEWLKRVIDYVNDPIGDMRLILPLALITIALVRGIGFFIGKASNGDDITIYGDGSLKRTFTHLQDIFLSMYEAIQLRSTINNSYNIGSNDHLSLSEVATMIAEKYGVKTKFVEWPKEALAIESGDTIFDDHKLKEELEYEYEFSFAKWLQNN